MPDQNGNFKGISVPELPWLKYLPPFEEEEVKLIVPTKVEPVDPKDWEI